MLSSIISVDMQSSLTYHHLNFPAVVFSFTSSRKTLSLPEANKSFPKVPIIRCIYSATFLGSRLPCSIYCSTSANTARQSRCSAFSLSLLTIVSSRFAASNRQSSPNLLLSVENDGILRVRQFYGALFKVKHISA